MVGWGWVIVLCWISFLLGLLTMGRLTAASRALDEAEKDRDPKQL